jgi:predicted RNase H-like HicB family nuclease
MASHSLVRLGYSHTEVMQMTEDELDEWLETAREYNRIAARRSNG